MPNASQVKKYLHIPITPSHHNDSHVLLQNSLAGHFTNTAGGRHHLSVLLRV